MPRRDNANLVDLGGGVFASQDAYPRMRISRFFERSKIILYSFPLLAQLMRARALFAEFFTLQSPPALTSDSLARGT